MVGDHDWFAVSLVAGSIYQFDLTGTTLVDPELFLYDANGTLVGSNNDIIFGIDLTSRLFYTASTTGIYYLDAASHSATGTGSYTINVTSHTITGTAGNDNLVGTNGDDVFNALAGNDTINGGLGNDTANYSGTAAEYKLAYNLGTVTVTDTNLLNGNEGLDTLTQIDTLHFADKNLNVNFDREFYLAKYADLRAAFGTNLELAAKHYFSNGFKEGRIVDNSGNDTLNGSDSADNLNGGAGNDLINGKGGDDLITAGDGNDTANGGLGNDTVNGGPGNDTANYSGAAADYKLAYNLGTVTVTDTNLLNGNEGLDTLTQIDTLHFADKNLNVNFDREFYLAKYADLRAAFGTNLELAAKHYFSNGFKEGRIVDNSGNDTLNGSDSADNLNGGAGNDLINGKGGDDVINGGTGSNVLTGGTGNDIFQLLDFATNKITDFTSGQDTIQLSSGIFTALNYTGVLNVDNFAIGSSATTVNQHVIYDNTTGTLSYDADGSGAGVATSIALLGASLPLTHLDFLLS